MVLAIFGLRCIIPVNHGIFLEYWSCSYHCKRLLTICVEYCTLLTLWQPANIAVDEDGLVPAAIQPAPHLSTAKADECLLNLLPDVELQRAFCLFLFKHMHSTGLFASIPLGSWTHVQTVLDWENSLQKLTQWLSCLEKNKQPDTVEITDGNNDDKHSTIFIVHLSLSNCYFLEGNASLHAVTQYQLITIVTARADSSVWEIFTAMFIRPFVMVLANPIDQANYQYQ